MRMTVGILLFAQHYDHFAGVCGKNAETIFLGPGCRKNANPVEHSGELEETGYRLAHQTLAISIVYFAASAPFTFGDDLIRAGFRVFEALAISEVLLLCETEKTDIVVIDANVQRYRAREIAHHHATLHLKRETTAQEIIAELWRLFPDKTTRIH